MQDFNNMEEKEPDWMSWNTTANRTEAFFDTIYEVMTSLEYAI